MKGNKKSYQFVIIVKNADEKLSKDTTKIFPAGCQDASVRVNHGDIYVDFNRRAASLEEAIMSAFNEIDERLQTRH